MPEIGGFRACWMVVDDLGVAGDDQHRRQPGRNEKHAADPEVPQIKLVELSDLRQSFEANPECEFGCMVFSQLVPDAKRK
jgi:hypothetical protein